MNRREFLTGAAAAIIAGPAAIKDGVALSSMAHPMAIGALDTAVLTEASLMRYLIHVHGVDAYGKSFSKMIPFKMPVSK